MEKLVVYFNADRPIPFSRVEDLKGRRIGVLRGWSYGDAFDNLRNNGEFIVEEVSSDDQNFHKLESKRLDVVIVISESGSVLAPRYPNIEAAPACLIRNPTFLAFSKSSARTDLLKRFDVALKEMQKSGEARELVGEELSR
jgi:polar amino acid transport system substrate-binding protein